MSKNDPETTLRQILSYSQEAVRIVSGKNRQDLDRDRLLNLALTRLLEIVGEAANRVPNDVKLKYPEIPWMQIIG